ncbi:hypothetical protein ACZ90_59275 [Streptomyces albus subsp. albus]|nr:hypothetical protein ACZ90_59275 [Streptomyces albus subsp. albus]
MSGGGAVALDGSALRPDQPGAPLVEAYPRTAYLARTAPPPLPAPPQPHAEGPQQSLGTAVRRRPAGATEPGWPADGTRAPWTPYGRTGPGLADPLSLAEQARLAYTRGGDPEALERGLAAAREAVRRSGSRPAGDRYRVLSLSALGGLLRLSHERDGAPDTLAEAVEAGRSAVREASPEDPEYSRHLSGLALTLREVFDLAFDATALDESIALLRRCLMVCPSNHPEYPGLRSRLGSALLRRAQYEPDPEVLDEAVLLARSAVRGTPAGDPRLAGRLAELGAALLQSAVTAADLTALEEAIGAYRRVLELLPPGHAGRDGARTALDSCLRSRQAIQAARQTRDRGRGHGSRRPSGGAGAEEWRHASARYAAYELSGDPSELAAAVSGFEAALRRATGPGPRARAAVGLGTALWSRYEHCPDRRDLDQAVDLFREALAEGPPEDAAASWDPARGAPSEPPAAVRAKLSGVLRLRWLRGGDRRDLADAVRLARAAVAGSAPGAPGDCERLLGLAGCLTAEFGHTREPAVLAEAVEVLREAVAVAPPDCEARPWALSNLGEALRGWAARGGPDAAAALDEAVALARAALAAAPLGHRLHPRFQAGLAHGLAQRYAAHRDPADLAAAATAGQRAVDAAPAGSPARPEWLRALVTVARLEYELRRTDAALDALIDRAGEAARAMPAGHPLRAQALTEYADALGLRGASRQHRADLLAAESAYREVAEDPTAAVRQRVRAARSWAYRAYAVGGATRALAPAALAVRLLPRTAPPGPATGLPHPEPSPCTGPETARPAPQDRAAPTGTPPGTGHGAAEPAWPTAEDRPTAGRPPLGEGTGPSGERTGPSPFAGVGSYAAACAIESGEPRLALALLEQARGVLLEQALDTRGTLAGLREVHPALTDRFVQLRTALDRPPPLGFSAGPAGVPGPSGRVTGGSGLTPPAEDPFALAEEWRRLVDRIRRQPGCADFLRPPEVPELLEAARALGPVVVVNVSPLRCDALLLAEGELRTVPLPGLGHRELPRHTRRFLDAVRAAHDPAVAAVGRQTAQGEVHEALEWLWDTVAEPVLTALRLTGRQRRDRPLPRLWWVPTGPLTALPLHAAQRRSPSGTVLDSVLDRVVSSYAPTVSELVRSQARRARQPGRAAGDPAHGTGPDTGPMTPLVVAPATPGAAGRGGRHGTGRRSGGREPAGAARVLAGERARRAVVLDTLPRHRWVHVACPAVDVPDDPGSSGLVLPDHWVRPLTVRDIARLGLPDAELACLPECGAPGVRETGADDAVHIAGAFQLAGYRHVVGTFWTTGEEATARITEDFYAGLAERPASPGPPGPPAPSTGSPGTARPVPSARDAAYALHRAVRELRRARPETPTLWAAHLHMGP